MRKYLFLILFLGSLSAARGQTNWHYDYWFDNADYSTLKTGTNGNGSNTFQIDADVSGLSEGLHSINIQAVGQSNAIVGFRKVKNENLSNDELNVLVEDVVVNTEVQTLRSTPVTRYFVKAAQQTTARCWYDNDMSTLQSGVKTGETVMLDATKISDGFHWLNVQAVGDGGGLSTTHIYPFVKIPQVIGVDHMTCLCMIDDQLYKQEQVSASNGIVAWNIDVASLPQGFHRMFIQVVTPSGAATALYQGFFFRETTRTEFGEMKCVYAIDGGNFDNVAGTLANGTFHFDLDVASLSDGLHRISYMLSNGKGVTTKVQTQFFTKVPLGGYGTVEYWYWLNDDDQNPVKEKVDPRQTPFNVTGLVSIPEVPIRSTQFAFSIENGKPYISAKNTFHMRFYDASGRFADLNKDFVDARVKQEVAETSLLEAITLGARQQGPMRAPAGQTIKSVTITKPTDNAISWFRMEAKAGDSLQFHLDRPATMQLFSPTGKEVYSAQGAPSVQWGGIHVTEAGTYYLAVHDATSTYGSSLTLYYEFIDRYAVLRQDISTVGNGGPSTITFEGNGYDKLEKVSLVKGSTTLNSVEIGHESKAVTSVKFDFGGAPLGNYDAVFYFKDGEETETLTVTDCITVEQAVPVFIDGYVSFAPQFLVARGNQYDFHMTNHGNMTAYDYAMQLCIFTTDAAKVLKVLVNNVELTGGTTQASEAIEGLTTQTCFDLVRQLRPNTTEVYSITVITDNVGPIHVKLDDIGGGSTAVASLDPNDIYGYLDENGSKFIKKGVTDVYYTIEFENDPAFATAPAHDIYVTDVLDPTLFDLSTYKPTHIQIGEKKAELTGDQNFVTTVDMRPAINAIAQVEGTFNAETGAIQWHLSSLDPMTLDPTNELMDGILPVNSDGNGIGRLSFDIALKPDLAVGTKIPNKAIITFDTNTPIETPTWTNIIGSNLKGDANQDGSVNVTDIVATVNYIMENPTGDFNTKAADVNEDGFINVTDIVGMVNIIMTSGSRMDQQEVMAVLKEYGFIFKGDK